VIGGTPWSSNPPATASAIGRRASRRGWIAVGIGALGFLAASAGVILAGPLLLPDGPAATWASTLDTPPAVEAGVPFDLRLTASNPAARTTERLWVVIHWRLADQAAGSTPNGRLARCSPADCRYRDDPAAGKTVVFWSGLAAGASQDYVVTVTVDGAPNRRTLPLRVTAATGPSEGSLRAMTTWTLQLEAR
jgi:hypothetical protein